MIISTGSALIEIGYMSAIGIKADNKVKSIIGLYIKDVYGNEKLYSMKTADVLDIIRNASAGKPVDISAVASTIMKESMQDIVSAGWLEITFDELVKFAKLESSYNFSIADY